MNTDKIIFDFGALVQGITDTTNELINKISDFAKTALANKEGKQLRFHYPIDVATKCPIKTLWLDGDKVMFTDEEYMDSNFNEAEITPNEAIEIALDLTSSHYTIEDKDADEEE